MNIDNTSDFFYMSMFRWNAVVPANLQLTPDERTVALFTVEVAQTITSKHLGTDDPLDF